MTTDVPIVDHRYSLRNVGGAGAVLNLPINLTSNKMRRYYWHQTTHQRPIAMSLVYSEYPSIATQSKLLRASNRLHLQPLSDPEDDPLELVALRKAGFDFVVLHSRYINEFWAMEAGDYVPYLNHYLGNGLVFEDGTIVYPLTQENLSELAVRRSQQPRTVQRSLRIGSLWRSFLNSVGTILGFNRRFCGRWVS